MTTAESPPQVRGIKLPFQIYGREVWVNGNRLTDFGAIREGVSEPFYISNGPEGLATETFLGKDDGWSRIEASWATFATSQEAASWACDAANVSRIDLATYIPPASGPYVPASLDAILGTTLAMLAKLPTPPEDIRGLILRKIGLWVFPDVSDEDFLKEPRDIIGYVQQNHDQTKHKMAAAPAPVPAPEAPVRRYFIEGSYTCQESGRATFTRTADYSGIVSLTFQQMRECIEGLNSRDDMVAALEEYVMGEESFGCDDYRDTEYDNEEATDTDGREDWDINAESVLESFLEENPEFDPDREAEEEEEEEEEEEGEADEPIVADIPFSVGMRVLVARAGLPAGHPDGLAGTLRLPEGGHWLVEFDEPHAGMHYGNAVYQTAERCGYYVRSCYMTALATA